MTSPSVSVVLPAFNEAGTIEDVVRRLDRVLDRLPGRHEIIIVDDGSVDATGAIAERLAAELDRARVLHHGVNHGYGAAQQTGLTAARGDLVWVLPADGQIPPEALPKYLEAADHADVVVGAYRARPLARRLSSRVYAFVLWTAFGVKLRNVNAPKLYRRSDLEGVRITAHGGFADAEIVIQLRARGRRFAEIEIECLPRIAGRSSTGLRAALQALWELYRFKRARGRLRREPQ